MHKQYLMRLDDASEYMDVDLWKRMEKILDKYNIKPIVGVIPNNKDPDLTDYPKDLRFWDKTRKWESKGWSIALHGYDHVYLSNNGGLNPINYQSEFAGVCLSMQKEKIEKGLKILHQKGHNPKIFFAPSHTFDENTLLALKDKSDIRVISDTIANNIYFEKDFYFIPQQSGKVRSLPFRTTTFCYHPNIMSNKCFFDLELFLKENHQYFVDFNNIDLPKRNKSLLDRILRYIYFKIYKRIV